MYDSYLLKDVHSVLVNFPREYAQEGMMLYIWCLLVVLGGCLLLVSQILDINRLFTSEFSRNFKLFFEKSGKIWKNQRCRIFWKNLFFYVKRVLWNFLEG